MIYAYFSIVPNELNLFIAIILFILLCFDIITPIYVCLIVTIIIYKLVRQCTDIRLMSVVPVVSGEKSAGI